LFNDGRSSQNCLSLGKDDLLWQIQQTSMSGWHVSPVVDPFMWSMNPLIWRVTSGEHSLTFGRVPREKESEHRNRERHDLNIGPKNPLLKVHGERPVHPGKSKTSPFLFAVQIHGM